MRNICNVIRMWTNDTITQNGLENIKHGRVRVCERVKTCDKWFNEPIKRLLLHSN